MQNREILINWICCPVCGDKTRNRMRRYGIEKLSVLREIILQNLM